MTPLTSVAQAASLDFDAVIDVRSPADYALDPLPGAINLPALDDDERARVGRICKQGPAFDARKIGAALEIDALRRLPCGGGAAVTPPGFLRFRA